MKLWFQFGCIITLLIGNIWTRCTLYWKWSCHSFITVKAPGGHCLILDVLIFWKNVWLSFFLLICLSFSCAGLKDPNQFYQSVYTAMVWCTRTRMNLGQTQHFSLTSSPLISIHSTREPRATSTAVRAGPSGP